MKKTKEQMRLNFRALNEEGLKKDLLDSIIKCSAYYQGSPKTYGFDIPKNLSETEVEEMISIEKSPNTPIRNQKLNEFSSLLSQKPEFAESFEKAKIAQSKHMVEAPRAWEKYKTDVNMYINKQLNLDDLGMDDITVRVGCGISSSAGPNTILYGGSSSNLENDNDPTFRVRNFLHEFLHCVESKQELERGVASHSAIFVFERYFQLAKLGGKRRHDSFGPFQPWIAEMKEDFLNYMVHKGEKADDVINFLKEFCIQIDKSKIKSNELIKDDPSMKDFLGFRSKWHDIEMQRRNYEKRNENTKGN